MIYNLGWRPRSVRFAEDAKGHEHKGTGPGGGQFTSKGGGGDSAPAEPAKTPEAAPAAPPATDRPKRDRSPLYPDQPAKKEIKRIPGLTTEDATIEEKSIAKVQGDFPALREKYLKDPENATLDDKGGVKSVTLNVDQWRGLFDGYTGTNAVATHAASGAANRELTAEMFKEQAGKGNNTLLIMAGGGGSGKGTAVKKFFDRNAYPIVLDQVSDRLDRLEGNIDDAAKAGLGASFTFIDRGAESAWSGVVQRAVDLRKNGELARTVPLEVSVRSNAAARQAALEFLEKRPDVEAKVIDNTGGPGKQRMIEDRTAAIAYLKGRIAAEAEAAPGLEDRLRADVIKRNSSGEIADDITKGLVGHALSADQLLEKIKDTGGFTYQPSIANSPKEGMALSIFQKAEKVIDAKSISRADILAYLDTNADLFKDKTVHFGAWYDTESGKVYLDLSKIVSDPAEAEALCKQHNQEGYYDLKAGKTVIVKKAEDRRIDKPTQPAPATPQLAS